MKLRTGAFAALIAVALLGCGAGDPCNRTSPCPNDPLPTQSQRDSCHSRLDANKNSPCINENLAFSGCYASSTLCASNGKTDFLNTLTKASNDCVTTRSAFTTCCNQNPTASACYTSF